MPSSALLLIDIQNDFCPGGALAVEQGDAVVPLANALQDKFELIIATQDWHPADHKSFAESHPGADPFSTTTMPYGEQVLWPTHCVQGTSGAAFHAGLKTDRVAMTIRKGFRPEIDSYSALFENDQKTPTGLAGYLREHGVEQVALCGLATDYCVAYSALDAAKLDFSVTVFEDACRAIDLNGSLADAKAQMKEAGVTLASSADL